MGFAASAAQMGHAWWRTWVVEAGGLEGHHWLHSCPQILEIWTLTGSHIHTHTTLTPHTPIHTYTNTHRLTHTLTHTLIGSHTHTHTHTPHTPIHTHTHTHTFHLLSNPS